MSCIRCLCLFSNIGVGFFLGGGVFTLLQMLPVSLDCPFCIAPSVFSSVCFHGYHLIPFDFRCTLSFFYTKKYVL